MKGGKREKRKKYLEKTWEQFGCYDLVQLLLTMKKARENESDLDAIGIRFASDWLRRWHEFSEPITVQNEENQSIPR